MKLTEYRNLIRQDFLDLTPTARTFEDETIDRAIHSAIEDISRLVPHRKVAEIRSVSTSQSTTYVKNADTDTYTQVSLGSPTRLGSVVVTNGGTTYTRNTDYIIDHLNGIITFPTGSAILALANPTTITITFEKSRNAFSLSSLTNLRSVEAVNVYTGTSYDDKAYEILAQSNIISFNAGYEVPNNYYLLVSYLARHDLPTDDSDGSLPDALSELAIKGAEAQLLFAKAVSLELAQSDNYDSLTTLDAYFTLITDDLTLGRQNLALAATRVSAAITELTSQDTGIDADLTAMTAAIAAYETLIAAINAIITSALATSDTEVAADIALADTAIGNVTTQITSSIASMGLGALFIDTEIVNDLTVAMTALTTTLQGYLDLGDDFINAVNTGHDPAEVYRKYAETAVAKASGIMEASKIRLAASEEYRAQANNHIEYAKLYINQVSAQLEKAKLRLEYAGMLTQVVDRYIAAARTRLEHAQAYVARIEVRVKYVQSLTDTASKYTEVAAGYFRSAELAVSVINGGVGRATEVRAQGAFVIEVAERLRQEAIRRYNDFERLISSRSQTSLSRVEVGRQQPNR